MKKVGFISKIRHFFSANKVLVCTFLTGSLAFIAFIGEVVYFNTKTVNGSYPDYLLLVLLPTIGIGLTMLVVFTFALLHFMWRKIRVWTIVIALLVFMLPAGLFIYIIGKTSYLNDQGDTQQITGDPNFTGQQLFDAVNIYRKQNNVAEIKLDDNLCNNLAQRYLDISKPENKDIAHAGFEEWVKKYVPNNYAVSEDIAWGNTPEGVVKAWDGSPGHRLSILNPKNVVGCSYAANGTGIIELGYKIISSQVSSNNESMIVCTGPDGKTFKTTQFECNQFNSAWNVKTPTPTQNNSNNYSYTQKTYYPCTLCYRYTGCSTYDYLYESKEACDAAQDRIVLLYGTPTPTPLISITPTPTINP